MNGKNESSKRGHLKKYRKEYFIERKKTEMRDIFISYSSKDDILAHALCNLLRKCSITTFIAPDDLTISDNYSDFIANAIKMSREFLVLVTENSINNERVRKELECAIIEASDRSKMILPICFSYDIIEKLPLRLKYMLSNIQFLKADGTTPDDLENLANQIKDIITGIDDINLLYEKLSEYMKIKAYDKATETICSILTLVSKKILLASCAVERHSLWKEIYQCMEKLPLLCTYDYGSEAADLAHRKIEVINEVNNLLCAEEFQNNNLYYISLAIRLLFLYREIRLDCADVITKGDVSQGIVKTLPESYYAEKQDIYVQRFHREMELQKILAENKGRYSDEEIKFIIETPDYIYQKPTRLPQDNLSSSLTSLSTEDELLHSVATFIREGNHIFDLIGEQEGSEDFLRCLITSYERLKSYCDVVGEKRICAECVDRVVELRHKLEVASVYENMPSEKPNTGIRTLLGLTIPKSGNYDVFISYKHEDRDIAYDMYQFFKRNLKEAFYDRVSIPEMSTSEYENTIMEALDGSKHFVVILSNLKDLQSHWIDLEMKTFKSEINEGRKPNSNFLLVVTNSVYDQIINSNKMELPIQYRRCEVVRVEEYKKVILSYL